MPDSPTPEHLHRLFEFPNDWKKEQISDDVFIPGYDAAAQAAQYDKTMADVLSALDKLLSAVQTVSYLIPGPQGIAASAGIGLVWNIIRPGETEGAYSESLSDIMSKVVSESMAEEAFKNARGTLDQFNKDIIVAEASCIPKKADDIHGAISRAQSILASVKTGGALAVAFSSLLHRLPWYNASAHTLFISVVESIQFAYGLVLCTYHGVAAFALERGMVSVYNQAMDQINFVLNSLAGLFEGYKTEVQQQIELLREARIENSKVVTETTTVLLETWPTEAYVLDAVTTPSPGDQPKHVFRVKVNGRIPNTVLAILRYWPGTGEHPWHSIHLAKLNSYLPTVMEGALAEYRSRLPAATDRAFKDLLVGLDRLVTVSSQLFGVPKDREPKAENLKNGPLPVHDEKGSTKLVKVGVLPANVELPEAGTPVSFKYELFVKDVKPSTQEGEEPIVSYRFICSSPWSDMVEVEQGDQLLQMHIADGGATIPTTRQIRFRTKPTDEKGTFIGQVEGLGILQWPEDETYAVA